MVASWVAQASFEPLGLTIAVAKDRAIESLMQVSWRGLPPCRGCSIHRLSYPRAACHARPLARLRCGDNTALDRESAGGGGALKL